MMRNQNKQTFLISEVTASTDKKKYARGWNKDNDNLIDRFTLIKNHRTQALITTKDHCIKRTTNPPRCNPLLTT